MEDWRSFEREGHVYLFHLFPGPICKVYQVTGTALGVTETTLLCHLDRIASLHYRFVGTMLNGNTTRGVIN